LKVAAFIANRIAFNRSTGSGGKRSFSRFIIRLSTVATVISVMVMIVTLSLANGFQEKVSQKVFSFLGHIRIQEKQPDKAIISEETPITKDDELVKTISRNPEVSGIYPYATKYGILKTKDEIEGVLVKGLDSTYDFNRLAEFIREGRPVRFNDSSYAREIMLSRYTATQLKLKVNDSILIYFIRSGVQDEGNPDAPNIRARKLTVVGIFQTGIEDYDKTFAIADMLMIQRLNADSVNTDDYKKEIGGYEVFLHDYKKIDTMSNQIYELSDFPFTWNTVSAKQISPNIFDWLNMQDVTRNVLIGFMVIVAVINLITCLIILVLERVRMIGILKSLGATDWTVQKIFLRHSALITITGIVTGTLLALGLLWLQQATGFIRLKEEAYYLSTAAVKIVWWQVGLICAGTFIVCFLVMMIPSLLVRKVQPVKAIQFR
jgi:lipoprotein-releasing system permease protein